MGSFALPTLYLWITYLRFDLIPLKTRDLDMFSDLFRSLFTYTIYNCRTILPAQNQPKTPCFRAFSPTPPPEIFKAELFSSTVGIRYSIKPHLAAQKGSFSALTGAHPGREPDQRSTQFVNRRATRCVSTARWSYPQNYLKATLLAYG